MPNNLYIITPGTTPKVTISAKLSKSFPIGETTLSNRAANPSKKSKIAANPTKYADITKSPSNALTIAKQPHNRLQHVIVFGMYCLIFIFYVNII